MNLTLGTLAELKVQLLNAALRDATTYDGTLAALGKAVAGRFEKFCDRKFARVVDDTFTCPADRAHVVLERYPLEEIASLEIRETLSGGWVDQGTVEDIIEQLREKSGIVRFGSELGPRSSELRLTYTGGYWLDTSADGTIGNVGSRQQGTATLAANDESKAIVFDQEFSEAPNVEVHVVIPSGGLIIAAAPSSITASGFTAILGYPIPSSSYSLQWSASTSTATEEQSSLPDGATEVPDDLKGAWLMQCEQAWALKDKLGISIGENAEKRPTLNLSSLQLVPEVEKILNSYRRLDLLG